MKTVMIPISKVRPNTNSMRYCAVPSINLVADIRKYGLVNPITVVKSKTGYTVKHGDLRLMAFVILNKMNNKLFREIPAIVVNEGE